MSDDEKGTEVEGGHRQPPGGKHRQPVRSTRRASTSRRDPQPNAAHSAHQERNAKQRQARRPGLRDHRHDGRLVSGNPAEVKMSEPLDIAEIGRKQRRRGDQTCKRGIPGSTNRPGHVCVSESQKVDQEEYERDKKQTTTYETEHNCDPPSDGRRAVGPGARCTKPVWLGRRPGYTGASIQCICSLPRPGLYHRPDRSLPFRPVCGLATWLGPANQPVHAFALSTPGARIAQERARSVAGI